MTSCRACARRERQALAARTIPLIDAALARIPCEPFRFFDF